MNLDDCNKCGGGPCHMEHDSPYATTPMPNEMNWEEKFDKEYSQEYRYPWGVQGTLSKSLKDFIRTLLTENRNATVRECVELVEEHDPSTGRKTSEAYWGNTLRTALLALIDTKV